MDSKEEKSTSTPEAASKKDLQEHPHIKKVMSLESLVFFIIVAALFGLLGTQMGAINMINTMMQTAYQLLLDTVFYIMAIAVLAGALSGLFTEFGIVAIINKILSPLMKPIYDLPGASVVGILATYLSDNPAILTLAEDQGFRRYFKRYQLPALTNIGTAFGMGLIITSFMVGILSPSGESFVVPALIGNLGQVQWTYAAPDGTAVTRSVTLEEVDAALPDWIAAYDLDAGADWTAPESVKDYAASPAAVQRLIDLTDYGFYVHTVEDGTNVFNPWP